MIDYKQIDDIMLRQDWAEIARRTYSNSDMTCPGGCFVTLTGEVKFAETMVEIDGLPIAFAYEDDLQYILLEWFETNCSSSFPLAKSAFEAEATRLSN